mmetsp:Transcript_15720/g.37953  ORF Transcript_15720/g.37953 Transcript_15720/m.37953 type:complete len:215 (+) Transcript_15720:241-885(+)
MVKIPCRDSSALICTRQGSVCGGSSTRYTPRSALTQGGRSSGREYRATRSKGPCLFRVRCFLAPILVPLGMISTTFSTPSSGTDEATGSSPSPCSWFPAASSPSVLGKEMYPTAMPWATLSTTSNSRTLNMGLSIAACRQHPRATASSAFRVRLNCSGCRLNFAPTNRWKNGTRLAPPTISTVLISSTDTGAPSTARSSTAWIFPIIGSHIFSN